MMRRLHNLKSATINYHFLDTNSDFDYHDLRRDAHQKMYAECLLAEKNLRGRVLDIGCGHGINPAYVHISGQIGQLDGVDPFPQIEPVQHLTNRWTCRVENLTVQAGSYDMAYSYNVIEHVDSEDGFLAKVVELLKPGGVYWSLSPNRNHPFTVATRVAQFLHLKSLYVKKINRRANDYPAYYRLSSDRRILRSLDKQKLPISKIDFSTCPACNGTIISRTGSDSSRTCLTSVSS